MMKPHWSLDDIAWSRFDASKVDPETLKAVKAAAMVEYNAADYVKYLGQVFASDPEMMAALTQWGHEEEQHGLALARWATMADPNFNFETSFKRFRDGYQVPASVASSVRGSRAGEMVARCVVESGTSSYYSAIRDASDEPVLKEIAALIAADEFRHYRLFYEGFLKYQKLEQRPLMERLKVALGRVLEAEDDELAYAYYAANEANQGLKYDRAHYSREYNRRVLRFYRPKHIQKGVAMIAKAVGLPPQGKLSRWAANVLWWTIRARGRMLQAQ